ncbi:LacI family DNA-binding transcriptional regulator [Streptomyces iranensis]|uniref:Transcriptional regulator n=1 Tax=Streptomyces iranensis TaxID=576784 RepID=A0A061A3X6_9ACTN|nr:LacI family DNA-binding transcriptional regulator [Streptomyces iranensis]MBP2067483.1 DNA-binding LacI/PurR family transcriptional regulator [Streptomyces iranensis]CDR17523.1 transcriptional regulator [Streptomyces iranensis]
MATTLRQVAREAGVSPSTASRALTRPDMISPQTAARVRAAAARLRYVPNRAAISLNSGTTGTLGLVVHALTNPLYARLARAVHRRAEAAGLGLEIVDTFETDEREARLLGQLVGRVDGVISVASRLPAADLLTIGAQVPLVLINRRCGGLSSVIIDVPTGIARCLDHLADLGHRRIVYVSGPVRTWSDHQRRRRVQDRARLYDLEIETIGPAPPVFHAGVAAADRARTSGATALIAYNSLIALGALYRLADQGISVPGQMSVVSGDDLDTVGAADLSVTALHLPLDDAAREAVALLPSEGATTEPKLVTLPTTLIPRGSSGRAPEVATH